MFSRRWIGFISSRIVRRGSAVNCTHREGICRRASRIVTRVTILCGDKSDSAGTGKNDRCGSISRIKFCGAGFYRDRNWEAGVVSWRIPREDWGRNVDVDLIRDLNRPAYCLDRLVDSKISNLVLCRIIDGIASLVGDKGNISSTSKGNCVVGKTIRDAVRYRICSVNSDTIRKRFTIGKVVCHIVGVACDHLIGCHRNHLVRENSKILCWARSNRNGYWKTR